MTAVVNPYLDGNFAPARSEITALRLLVLGSYPLTYVEYLFAMVPIPVPTPRALPLV